MEEHEYFMLQCLQLASLGKGSVSPNPMVGAVLVYENEIIGKGYHQQYGQNHAEVNCLASVKENDKIKIPASTLYVSLEPCCHTGKTPPCVDLILKEKIKKVVVACTDTSSKVNGLGITLLREHNVEVIENVLSEEAREVNKRFFCYHEKKRPYIILKWAQSREGIIGNHERQVKLTNANTDQIVHRWRAEEDAIWVGYHTAKVDNPLLNVRHTHGNNPIRVIYDRDLSLPKALHLFDQTQATIIFNHIKNHKEENLQWIQCKDENNLNEILTHLQGHQVLSVVIEGGQNLLQQFINQNLWDEARCIHTKTSLDQGILSPLLPRLRPEHIDDSEGDMLFFYNNPLR